MLLTLVGAQGVRQAQSHKIVSRGSMAWISHIYKKMDE